MKIRITLDCENETEAHSAMERLLGIPGRAVTVIDPLDNPEHGANVIAVQQGAGKPMLAVPMPPVAPLAVAQPTTGLGNVGFGQGVTLPAGAIPIPAPASAVAGPSATVPAAPSGIPATPPVPTAPAQQPAPVAAALTVPAAPPASAPGAATLDTAGLPWDSRIHANTKTTNKDGTWRQKRELDPAIRTAVEAELRGVMAANAAAAAPVAQSAAPLVPAVPPAPTAAVPQPSTPAPVPPAASGASPSDFGSLMERLAPMMAAGQVTNEQVAAALGSVSLTALGQLALAPNLVPAVAAALGVA